VACGLGGGGTLILVLLLSCTAWPGLCDSFSGSVHFAVGCAGDGGAARL